MPRPLSRSFCAALLGLALLPQPTLAKQNVPMSHGHYCGVGNSDTGAAPIDALDAACMAHDQCAGDGSNPSCSCHSRFIRSVTAVSRDGNETPVVRSLAHNMAVVISRAPCTGAGRPKPLPLKPLPPIPAPSGGGRSS